MPYYNIAMRSSELQKVISDSYQILGRRATIDLLDNMNRFGFRMATPLRCRCHRLEERRADHFHQRQYRRRRSRLICAQ